MYATYEKVEIQSENKFSQLVHGQNIVIIPEFTLQSGHTLHKVPVAYKTWGTVNENRDNVMIICHALSGSADVQDWWGPLIGKGRAFDPTKFFIFCGNMFASPYGTASPITINPETGKYYGPEFPPTTPRDDVRLHKMILDSLGIKQVAICIGGSMGGMQVLEWSFYGPNYVKTIVPIATSARNSAWCISWNEAQRQSIYSDNKYCDGYYDHNDPPATGLSAARMSALLTYRSRDSFESRFGRKFHDPKNHPTATPSSKIRPSTPAEEALLIHNDGHRSENITSRENFLSKPKNCNGSESNNNVENRVETIDAKEWTENNDNEHSTKSVPNVFSAQSYLRYQGEKFVKRFDANCYISLTRKMDAHDVAKDRGDLEKVLISIKQPALIIGIESDGLFTISEQYELAEFIPNSEMVTIQSPDGHDGFLLEFDQINRHILRFIRKFLPDIAENELCDIKDVVGLDDDQKDVYGAEIKATKNSLFGEAEVIKW
ncbi:18585_t:CDS:2 [Funneliformis geosporum]|uniref:9318_t:CDS:1 n=1 Tax=Funneliformis geosporum TaxID=1117311 RepID=A0A9W4SNT9_9GLOM|nr:18585_t:CDS:2 [Funneliformis geosporum]CAI2173768.1 9318_t:CDS:2 [Funneliformis geosporum]